MHCYLYMNLTDKMLESNCTKHDLFMHFNNNLLLSIGLLGYQVQGTFLEEMEAPEYQLPLEFQKMLIMIEKNLNPVTVMIFDTANLHHNTSMRNKMLKALKELNVKVFEGDTNKEGKYIDIT